MKFALACSWGAATAVGKPSFPPTWEPAVKSSWDEWPGQVIHTTDRRVAGQEWGVSWQLHGGTGYLFHPLLLSHSLHSMTTVLAGETQAPTVYTRILVKAESVIISLQSSRENTNVFKCLPHKSPRQQPRPSQPCSEKCHSFG